MNQTHLWLRAETKPQEQRTALTPTGAKILLDAGFKVTVEDGQQNIFATAQYRQLGCEIAAQGSWRDAPAKAFILGLKELPEDTFPLLHRHIYFAHAYKEQAGADALLSRFCQGKGSLYDLEFLLDDSNRRVAAFGYWAGFAGAALSIWAWANKQLGHQVLPSLSSFSEQLALIAQVTSVLNHCQYKPRVMVIGAKGRSGSGAVAVAKALQLDVIEWDMAETAAGGPFAQVNEADVLVNCVLVDQDLPPFVTLQSLSSQTRKLAVIADVSCDPYGEYNPIRIYDRCSTFLQPTIEIISGRNSLDLIAIDHLPSLLPKESSEDYANQLVPTLLTLTDLSNPVWQKALDIFHQKSEHLKR